MDGGDCAGGRLGMSEIPEFQQAIDSLQEIYKDGMEGFIAWLQKTGGMIPRKNGRMRNRGQVRTLNGDATPPLIRWMVR
jgi:hypothetical protein